MKFFRKHAEDNIRKVRIGGRLVVKVSLAFRILSEEITNLPFTNILR